MIILFLILSSVASLFAADEIFFTQWNKLLHKDNQVNPGFWLAGKSASAQDELEATIKAFNSKENFDTNNHAQCLYPARRLLINKHMGNNLYPQSKCQDYDEWSARLNPQGISIVFAGNYPDNPGSLFGHTFMKFIGKETKEDLLDYALNYSAEVSDDIGVLYAIKGLIGGYYGGFSLAPYYVKVNEYAEAEGRDLWEYKTALTPEESQFILSHIWELKNRAEFHYFFLSDNCSSFILNLMDLARPEWQLESIMPWYVIPLETVKAMHTNKEIITETIYRPSVRLRSQNSFASLGINEQRKVKKILDQTTDLSQESDTRVLKVAAMQLAAIHSRKDGVLPEGLAQKEEDILVRLSELPADHSFKNKVLPSPHGGHDITQVSIGGIFDHREDLLLGYRLGVHDLNDYAVGYLPYSELVIMDAQARLNTNKLDLQSINFLSMNLLRPWTINEKEWSWGAKFSFENHSHVFSNNEKDLVLEGTIGAASLSYDSILMAFMVGAHFHGGNLDLKQATGLMSQVHLIANGEKWKSVNGIKLYQDINHTADSSYQIVPYSNFSIHTTPNWDYQLEFTYPLYLSDFQKTPSKLALKLEYHF